MVCNCLSSVSRRLRFSEFIGDLCMFTYSLSLWRIDCRMPFVIHGAILCRYLLNFTFLSGKQFFISSVMQFISFTQFCEGSSSRSVLYCMVWMSVATFSRKMPTFFGDLSTVIINSIFLKKF